MKFWQLLSIYNDELGIVEEAFKGRKEDWSLDAFKNIKKLVRLQNRDILDKKIDDALLKEISKKSRKKIYISVDGNTLYSYQNVDTNKCLSISEAIDLFDHDAIEEAFEKTSSIARGK